LSEACRLSRILEVVKGMVRVKASLIFLFLIVPIVRSSQVQANLSMAELEASDANTKYWLRTQNIGRIIGSPCSEDKCVEACAEGWEANGDHCYLFGDEKKNWTAAEDFCRGEGGHLATVNTNATKVFVLEGFNRRNIRQWTWIGGSDIEEEGVWKWTDCTKWEAEFWSSDNYNNYNQDCLILALHVHCNFNDLVDNNFRSFCNEVFSFMWDEFNCSVEMGFLCSKKICSSDNSEEEETTLLAENTNNSNNEEATTKADNNNGGNILSEEDTSGASVMWKLISSSFAVLLFLLF